jgi:hypothetical protein
MSKYKPPNAACTGETAVPRSGVCRTKQRMRWYQLSLRSLLIGITVFAVWGGWLANRARQQARSIMAVRRRDGDLYTFTGPDWIRRIVGERYFVKVVGVNLCRGDVEDNALKHLNGLRHMHGLRIRSHNITDRGLEHLSDLSNLQSLELYGTQVTDEGIKKLKRELPRLQVYRATYEDAWAHLYPERQDATLLDGTHP